jgi:hypothetical protein
MLDATKCITRLDEVAEDLKSSRAALLAGSMSADIAGQVTANCHETTQTVKTECYVAIIAGKMLGAPGLETLARQVAAGAGATASPPTQ